MGSFQPEFEPNWQVGFFYYWVTTEAQVNMDPNLNLTIFVKLVNQFAMLGVNNKNGLWLN